MPPDPKYAPSETLEPILESHATKLGYVPLTYPIDPVTEQWMLDNFIADMRRGHIPCVLVGQPNGVEVWRKSRFTT